MPKIYQGDVGTQIVLDTGADISQASKLRIDVSKPDGTTVQWNAALEGTSKIVYTTVAGDLNQVGTYMVQGYVELVDFRGHCDTVTFRVYARFA